MKTLVLSVLALFALQGAAQAQPKPGPALDPTSVTDVKWLLEDLGDGTIVDTGAVFLVLEGRGKLWGRAPVNRFTGTYRFVAPGRIQVSGIAATKMAGPPFAMKQEGRMLAHLGSATGVELKDGRLLIASSKFPRPMNFARAAVWFPTGPVALNDLAGTAWEVQLATKQFIEPAKRQTLVFGSGGRVSGFGGVNRYSGQAKGGAAGELSFGPLAATMMAGPSDALEREAHFFNALGLVSKVEFDGKSLRLSGAGMTRPILLLPKTR